MTTGETMWKFQSECSVTSDIAVFETDDALEEKSSKIDGYIDRAVWADACGNVYKVDPAQHLRGYMPSEFGQWATPPTVPEPERPIQIRAIHQSPAKAHYPFWAGENYNELR